jgi:dipeptidyl-peptidase-4
MRRLGLACALWAAAAVAGTSNGYDLDRLTGEPRLFGVAPRALAWAPAGPTRLGFLWSDRGVEASDLWIWEPAADKPRKLVDHEAVTGSRIEDRALDERRETLRLFDQGIGSFQWSPDGTRLLFETGGDLFIANPVNGSLTRLTYTEAPAIDPQFSPDGRAVVFVRDGDLWWAGLDSGAQLQLTNDGSATRLNGRSDYIALEELGFEHAFRVGPDSTRVAFVQYDTSPVAVLCVPDMLPDRVTCRDQRRPPAGSENSRLRIGIVTPGSEPIWAALPASLTDFYVTHLVWFDADHVLAGVETRDTQTLTVYSISASDGLARPVLVEHDNAWVNLTRTWIVPGDARSFVFGSERSGWPHAYRVDVETGTTTALTSGEWEVDSVDAAERGQVILHARRESPFDRQLYSVPLAGGTLERLTTAPGWHEAKRSPDGKWVATLFSDLVTPTDLWVGAPGAAPAAWKRVTFSPAADFEAARLITPRVVSIPTRRGSGKIAGLLWEPVGPVPKGGRPAIVYVHGAGYAQDVKRSFNRLGGFHSFMARCGYAVLSIDYRGSEGYGRAWRVAVYKALGDLDLDDSISAADWLAQNVAGVKRDRIGIWGTSYGGFLALMAAGRVPGSFAAHGAGAPVTNWKNYDTSYTEERLGLPQQNAQAYQQSSPLTYAGKVAGPLLLFHGLRDDNVHAQDSMQYADRLIEAGIRFEMMIYPAATHRRFSDAARRHSYDTLISFFDRTLRRSLESSR